MPQLLFLRVQACNKGRGSQAWRQSFSTLTLLYHLGNQLCQFLVLRVGKNKLSLHVLIDVFRQTVLFVFRHQITEIVLELLVVFGT